MNELAEPPDVAEAGTDLFEHCPVGYLLLDAEGRVVAANRAARELAGGDLRGTLLRDRVRDDGRVDLERHWAEVFSGSGRACCEVTWLRAGGGEGMEVRLESSMARDGRSCRTVILALDCRSDAELRLAESQERLSYALEAAAAGVWDWNLAADRVTWSPENYRVFDLDPADAPELTYEFWASRVVPEDLPAADAAVREALEGRTPEFRSEFRVVTRDGGSRWVFGFGRVERDPEGRPVRMSGLNIDLSARKAMEEALRESGRRFRVMADHVPLLLWVHDLEGNQLFVNRTFCDYFGVTAEDMRGERWKSLVHPDDVDRYADAFAASVARCEEFRSEVRVLRADGAWRWIESWGRPRLDETGAYVGHVGASMDITDRKRAEAAVAELTATLEQRVEERTRELRESEARLRFLADSIPHLVWVAGPDGSVVFVNRRAVDYFGLPGQENFGWDWVSFLHPEETGPYVASWVDCVRRGAEFNGRCRFLRAADGTYRWHRVHGVPVRDASGVTVNWYGTATDIHESELAEAESRRLSKVFAEAADAILLLDLDGNVVDMNPEAGRRYGWEPETLRGRPAHVLVPPDAQESFREALARCRAGETVRDLEGVRVTRTGERIPVLLTLSPFTDEEGATAGIVNIAKDLRAQKAVETQLRESRAVAELQRDIARFASRCRDLREMAAHCLEEVLAGSGWELGLALLPDEAAPGKLALAGMRLAGSGGGHLRRFATAVSRARMAGTEGWIGTVFASGEPAWTADLAAVFGDRAEDLAFRCGIRGAAAFPVPVGSEVTGVLLFFGENAPEVDARLAASVASVGVQLGLVMERVGAERDLRESEARLRLLTDRLRDAVWLQEGKPSRRVRHHNPAFRSWFCPGGEGPGEGPWNLAAYASPEERSYVAAAWERVWNGAEVDLECRLELPDGSRRWMRCRGYPVPDAQGRVGTVVGIAEDVSERQEAARVQRRLEEEVAKIAEEERLRISRELHDSLGSLLTGTRLRHQMILETIRDGKVPDVGEAETVAALIGEAISEARQLTRGLCPVGEHPEDLMQALRGLASGPRSPGTARCAFRGPEPVEIHDVRMANELYRIAQEAFHNALKHSGASRIGISLARRRGQVLLVVQDNGRGMDPDGGDSTRGKGHGLQIMECRAGSMGGRFAIGPARNGGTRVVCSVPSP
jgi:PAS domain S-box-containing protein